jgi:hypothetical protein
MYVCVYMCLYVCVTYRERAEADEAKASQMTNVCTHTNTYIHTYIHTYRERAEAAEAKKYR